MSSSRKGFFSTTGEHRLASDASSLVDLKAELFRKHQEAANTNAGSKDKRTSGLKLKGDRNKSVQSTNVAYEEEDQEAKVRERLEAKAKLYEKLRQGGADDQGRFLVQFKNDDDEDSDDDEWVEYEDALGRTRRCLKEDLPNMLKQDKELKKHVREDGKADKNDKIEKEEPDLMSEDMRRELLRAKWEAEEAENLHKRSVHYQDVRFDEARVHGAAFYKFSRDERERSEQQAQLDELHQQTQKAREERKWEQSRKKDAIKERLKRVRDKKRLKMGLPILPDDEEDKPKDDEIVEDQKSVNLEEQVMQGLKELREKEEREQVARLQKKRSAAVREWDLGKEGVRDDLKGYGEKKVMSQEEWNKKKREERPNDFAPPKFY